MHDIAIIGSGPAGLSAALYAGRAGRSVILFEGPVPGGQLTKTHDVENYPGRPRVNGFDLIMTMRGQLDDLIRRDHAAIDIVPQSVDSLAPHHSGWLLNGDRYARTVILATGSTPRRLGVPGEEAYENRGVSWCAVCDGMFHRGKDVAVIGGGNSAVEEAIYLANIARSVTLIHRRSTFRADATLQARLRQLPNLDLVLDATVARFEGGGSGLTTVVAQGQDGERRIPVTGAFVAIGHDPQTALIRDFAVLNAAGYAIPAWPECGYATMALGLPRDGKPARSLLGLHLAGDCADPVYRQAVSAAGTGCQAALDACRFIENLQALSSRPEGRLRAAE